MPEWSFMALALLLAYVVFAACALISIAKSRETSIPKVIWMLIVVVAPFIGSIVWFAVGRRMNLQNET